MKKKRNDKTQQIINYVVVIVLAVVCIFSYCRKEEALKSSNYTICKVLKKYRKPGVGIAKGKEAVIEYYVSGKRYEGIVWNSSDSYGVGDCFLLEYSISKPEVFKVLWDRGNQNCIE